MDQNRTIQWIDEDGTLHVETSEYARLVLGVLNMLSDAHERQLEKEKQEALVDER